MRYHMRVVGQVATIRGTVQSLNPQTGAFSVKFDVPLTGDDGVAVQTVGFVPDGTGGTVIDQVWGLSWELIS